MAEKEKRRRGDRKDAKLVRDCDSMHKFFPYMLPNRADNEAVLNETIDLTALEAYVAERSKDDPEFKFTFFHAICAALAKVLYLRPKMNRFYSGNRYYEKNDISFSFVVKKQLVDSGEETLAIVTLDKESELSPLQQFHDKTKKIVFSVRKENKNDGATDAMDILVKLPRFLQRAFVGGIRFLENHGWYPASLMKEDPYYSSVFISNLGSIKMKAQYHHLVNWGTNSIFVVVGEKKLTPIFAPDGTYEMRTTLDIGFTIDERIADGTYFAKSIRILRHLLAHPELLDRPLSEEVEIE